tara:strand:+ start:395 stop:754 length:360 start_codon:yes stop_codon:yes gene_type:complete
MDIVIRQHLLQRYQQAQSAVASIENHTTHPEYDDSLKPLFQSLAKTLDAIIKNRCWPGYTLVGAEGAEAAAYIACNAHFTPELQQSFKPALEHAVNVGEAPAQHLSELTERIRQVQDEA